MITQNNNRLLHTLTRYFLFFSVEIFFLPILVNGQEITVNYPKVGEQFNDHIFTDLLNSAEKTIDTKNYRGKWLILDFWSHGCTSCIASMPKIDKLSKIFADRAKIMMVAMYDNHGEKPSNQDVVKDVFSRWVKRHNLSFCSAFDSIVQRKYDIRFVPHILIINPEGKLVAKAGSIDSTILSGFIDGKKPAYRRAFSAHELSPSKYNPALPLFTNGHMTNGGVDTAVWCRSVLTKWDEDMPEYLVTGFTKPGNNEPISNWAQAIGLSLQELFSVAYFGVTGWGASDSLYTKVSMKPILEVKDPGRFIDITISGVLKSRENTYAYNLKMPSERANYLNARNILLNDLQSQLGYQSNLENRKVTVLKLVIADPVKAEKLKTKGSAFAIKQLKAQKATQFSISPDSIVYFSAKDRIGYRLYNYPFQSITDILGLGLSQMLKVQGIGKYNHPPVVNATGINYRVDMDIDADTKDWDATIQVLRKYGLDVVKSEMEMQCLVIRDAMTIVNKPDSK